MMKNADDARIAFDEDKQIMEVDFSDILFDSAKQVTDFYDLVDEKIAATGKDKWYFLVNYKNCRLSPAAWIPFARRGKQVNIAHSLGSARFAVSDATGKAILKQAEREDFDPNLFASRQSAIDHLVAMRAEAQNAPAEVQPEPQETTAPATAESALRTIAERISFIADQQVMEADFSNYTFAGLADVNEFYDVLADKLGETEQKWYFLVNYTGTKIFPDAWYQWAIRSRRLNAQYSLGTVRYNPDDAAKQEIIKRAQAAEADPNLVSTREKALARIAQMRDDNIKT